MLLLTSTSDKIRLTTSAAVTVDVQASYMDYNGSSVTPGRTNSLITTATTTDIVGSPGASTQRNVRSVTIRNKHATSSVDLTFIHTDGTNASEIYKFTLSAGYTMQFLDGIGFEIIPTVAQPIPSWYGNLYAAYGRCDPQQLLRMATMAGTVAATPTNISTTVARISYFRPPANITVNRVRYFGVGATTNIYRIAIYNGDTLARLTAETAFTTVNATWGVIFSALNLTLTKDQLYFIACSVNTTGTTAGILCMSNTNAATTGQIAVLPKSWPGNLNIDSGYIDGAFAQFAVTAGALPDPAATIAAGGVWTGGMPLFFLDASDSA